MIKYPIEDGLTKWSARLEGDYTLPGEIRPDDDGKKCKHGLVFDAGNLVTIARGVVIFTDNSDIHREVEVKGRPTSGIFSVKR